MKIALGTAQFDKDYGINRINRKFTYKQKKKLISFVKKNNIKTIDTAFAYKNAEKDLGKIGMKNFEIITKLPKLKKKEHRNPGKICYEKIYAKIKIKKFIWIINSQFR